MNQSIWEHPLDPTPLHRLVRHGRIWRRFVVIALAREAQFRANAISTVVVGIAHIVVSLIPVLLLFGFTSDVKGWSRPEVIALLGLFQVMTGIIETFLQPNMSRITNLVANGELDPVLLRPMSGQFYVMFRWISLANVFSIVAGMLILVIGLNQANASPGMLDIASAGIVALCGLVLLTCFWSAMVYLVFWSTSVHSISMLFSDLWYIGGYPRSFFPGGIRFFLTFVFPVAFATTVPIEFLLGRAEPEQIGVAILAATIAVWLVRTWWRFAVRFYASASS
jgi:ABC-2 type transport system permease protein